MPQGTAGTRILDKDSKAILSGYRSLMRVLIAKSSKEELSIVRKALKSAWMRTIKCAGSLASPIFYIP